MRYRMHIWTEKDYTARTAVLLSCMYGQLRLAYSVNKTPVKFLQQPAWLISRAWAAATYHTCAAADHAALQPQNAVLHRMIRDNAYCNAHHLSPSRSLAKATDHSARQAHTNTDNISSSALHSPHSSERHSTKKKCFRSTAGMAAMSIAQYSPSMHAYGTSIN